MVADVKQLLLGGNFLCIIRLMVDLKGHRLNDTTKYAIIPLNQSISFFFFGQYSVSPQPDRVTAIRSFSQPTTVKGMQEFLGVIIFCPQVYPQCHSDHVTTLC